MNDARNIEYKYVMTQGHVSSPSDPISVTSARVMVEIIDILFCFICVQDVVWEEPKHAQDIHSDNARRATLPNGFGCVNRRLDLSHYFDANSCNHVIVEDVAFGALDQEPNVRVIYAGDVESLADRKMAPTQAQQNKLKRTNDTESMGSMKSLGNLTKSIIAHVNNINSSRAARAIGSLKNGLGSVGSNYSPEH